MEHMRREQSPRRRGEMREGRAPDGEGRPNEGGGAMKADDGGQDACRQGHGAYEGYLRADKRGQGQGT